MRIQHNIMAMNAYRNYTNNVNAMKKNLEKLSSGYKINRAGDDAAGLAISEKMRAQITGLQQAQANAKSGINLVQTAEGALTEVHDMLNRMVKLADQSANGTYDDSVDRVQLQKEVNQLTDEINRIADSANFNGIKLLDGSLDFKAAGETIEATTISGNLRTGLFVPTADNADGKEVDLINGNKVSDGTDTVECVQGWGLYTHKEATGEAKTSFDVRFSNYELEGLTEGEEVTITLSLTNSNQAVNGYNPIAGTDKADADHVGTGVTVVAGPEITVAADEDGKVTGKMIADAIAKHYAENADGKVSLKNKSGIAIEYNITSDGNSLKFEMSDKGYQDAAAAYEDTWTDAKNWIFDGNYNVVLTTTVERTPEFNSAKGESTAGAGDAEDQQKADVLKQLKDAGWQAWDATTSTASALTDITTQAAQGKKLVNAAGQVFEVKTAFAYNANGSTALKMEGTVEVGKGWTDNSTSVTKKGSAAAGTQLADGLIGFNQHTWQKDNFKDASGIRIGDTNYVFASTDETFKAKYDANTKVIDIRDLVKDDGTLKSDEDINTALHRVADAAGDNKMWSVQVGNSGAILAIREREDYNGNGEGGRADLTTKAGIEATIQLFDKARAHSTPYEASGKSLTLQIGDTADDYNQLKVNIADMHASALGLDKIRIDDQAEAAKAVDVIKDAINKVSDVRGTLGATQNRLDHTINNLSVMTENIQDAESTIRDTDVADEMMAYTKNNILIQSAQAMLAQANQVPQGVLQLLQ